MPDLSPGATVALAGALVYAGSIALALCSRWTPRETESAEALTRLDARDEESTVTLDSPSRHRRN